MYVYDSFLDWHVWIWPNVRLVVFKWAIGIGLCKSGLMVIVSLWPLRIGLGRMS